MEYNWKQIGERLVKLRKARKWTQEDLIKILSEREENAFPIGRNSLSSLETGKLDHCDLRLFTALCSIYDCELGYLLGEHEGRTREATDVHEYTSLSYEAIERLHASKEVANVLNILFHSVSENRCLIDVIGEYLKFNVNQDVYISENGDLYPRERTNVSALERAINPGFYLGKEAFTELYLSEIRDWLKHIRETEGKS